MREIEIPTWLAITLERYAAERTLRWRGRHETKDHPAREAYDEMMDQLRDQFEVLEAGSGRIVIDISEHIDCSQRLVAKLVGSRSQNKNETVPVSGGFLQNWREILLSRYPPVQDIVQPVVASSRTGLWLVMPYAEQYGIEWDRDRIDAKADYLKEHEKVEPVMRGSLGGGLDIYWTENWGAYHGEYRLVDYGGIVLHDEPDFRDGEYPFEDPSWNQ